MPRRDLRPTPPRPRSLLTTTASVLGVLLVLTSCTAKGDPPSPTGSPDTPERAAAVLAAGIARLDVSQVEFTGASGPEVNNQLKPLVSGMGSLRPAVTVGPINTQGATAAATLRIAWSFTGVKQQWSYQSTAQLVEESGRWKTRWQPSMLQPRLDGSNRLRERRLPAARGEILGEDGDAIVTLRPVVRIGVDKSRVSADQSAASAARLAKLVGINARTYAAKVAAAGAKAFVEAIVVRAEAAERPSNAAVFAIPGAIPIQDDRMLGPSREFARAIIGTVGQASKETVDASKGAIVAGDEVGQSGLHRRFDEQLRGTPGVRVQLVAARTSTSASPSPGAAPTASPAPTPSAPVTVFEAEPIAGKDLTVTLSIALQNLAEQVLADTEPASALVAIRPSTGEILAAANGPGTNGLSAATVGQYPPGSTFKVATSLALLRAGLQPNSAVSCPPTVTVDGKRFKNYSDYPGSSLGTIDLQTALAQSCNTAFIGQRDKLAGGALADAAASLGVGADYDVGFASFFGSVPEDKTATGRAAAMIGQGKVEASPMAMAAVAASVSAGKTVIPSLVVGHSAKSKAKPLTPGEGAQLRKMMGAVVSEGSGRFLLSQGGPAIIAKTGTAEYGPKAPFKTHAWMIGAQGDLAVAVFVGEGSSGSKTAGPLLAKFLAGAR